MTKLSVNVNKIATLRNTRLHLQIPDLVRLSKIAIEAGAAGITIHPRPDERHIRATDVDAIANLLKSVNHSKLSHDNGILAPLSPKTGARGGNNTGEIEFNIEGNPFEGAYMDHCLRVRPTQCTLVPDTLAQSTSDHGWNLPEDLDRLRPVVEKLKSAGCRVSLFMDPIPEAMKHVLESGADRVELYTEPFAASFARGETTAASSYREAAIAAYELGLGINAGHDLNLDNLSIFLDAVPHVQEVSIGHALIADALEFGLFETVQKYLAICHR
jgi:pyridoxine 5-phosphate synthase